MARHSLRLVFAFALASVLASQNPEISLPLSREHPVEREISGGQVHTYRLDLSAGEYASLSVEQRGIDLYAQVVDPGGTIVEFDAESRKQGTEPVIVVAGAPTRYEVRIQPRYAKDPPGRYVIRVDEVRPATDRDRDLFESYRLGSEANRLTELSKLDDAVQTAERALALREKVSEPRDPYRGYLLYRVATLKRITGDYPGAEQTYRRAIAAREEVLGREDPQTAVAMRGLGQLYMSMGDYVRAEPLLQQGLEIVERTLGGDDPLVALGLRLTGLLHEYRHDLDRARADLERAVAIAEKRYGSKDIELVAVVHDLANCYLSLNDYDRAVPMLEKALKVTEEKFGKEHFQTASSLANLGFIALEKKQYDRALGLLQRAAAVREKNLGAGHPDTAMVVNQIADVYHATGDYAKSLEVRQKALDALALAAGPYHRLTQIALEGFAITYAASGQPSRALDYQRRAEEIQEKNISLNLAIGSEREKLEYVQQASVLTDRTLSFQTRLAFGDPAALDLAALVLLQRKGRVMDALSGSIAVLRQRLGEDDRKLLDQLSGTNTKLAKLALSGPGRMPAADYAKQLATLDAEREKLEAAISTRSAEFRAQSQPVALPAVKAAIPTGAALIEFAAYRPFDPRRARTDAYGPAHYVAYVLRSSGEGQSVELGPAREIDDAVAALRQALRDSHRTDVRQLARALDRRIMEPVRRLLGDTRQLLVSPDGALNLIPFEALVDERGAYLLERYSITYLTTGRDLLRMQVPLESRRRPVVFADPLFGEPSASYTARADRTTASTGRRSVTTGADLSTVYFAPLAGTATEARSIQSLFPEAELFTGSQATKTALARIEAPRILHIATHGFFLEDFPKWQEKGTRAISARANLENPLLRSGLALAGANLKREGKDDGILTALEAASLNLWGTKVVTLSACETGIGEVKNGEGIYGLRRAFFLAGAEALVMSLWPVSDQVTRQIMTGYYTGLKNGLGRGEALRQVQLALLRSKDRRHPFYWASFIEAGNWKNLDGK